MGFKDIIIREFQSSAVLDTKEKYTSYFKGVVKFYGLKSPQIKSIFQEVWKDIAKLDTEDKVDLAFELIGSEYQESKSFGILILEKEFKKLDAKFLNRLEGIIEQNVYDW